MISDILFGDMESEVLNIAVNYNYIVFDGIIIGCWCTHKVCSLNYLTEGHGLEKLHHGSKS
jgi:hypothetical protein